MPPPRYQPGPILEDLQVAPPYCDLYIADMDLTLDHDNKQIYLSAVIGNLGSFPPSGAILTSMDVWSDRVRGTGAMTQDLFQEWRWYHAGTSMPFRTLSMSFPFLYEDEGGRTSYITVKVGDDDNLPNDANLSNNLAITRWGPFLRPGTFTEEMEGALRRETRMGDDGEVTSTLTMDGKPFKASRSTTRSAAQRRK
jgi:hypothetical protein